MLLDPECLSGRSRYRGLVPGCRPEGPRALYEVSNPRIPGSQPAYSPSDRPSAASTLDLISLVSLR